MLTTTVAAVAVALASSVAQDKRTWYGPVTVAFHAQFGGNPYDPDQNDVRVRFAGPDGDTVERLAYFDAGVWKATLVAEKPGRYTPRLYRNGSPTSDAADPAQVVLDRAIPKGYVRRDPAATNRFAFDDGERYYPLGHNLGWQVNEITLPQQLKDMGANGVDWARVWAASWASMNPWWPNDADVKPGELWQKALDGWQKVVDAADQSGVKFQFVLFNHGSFSSTVNPNWAEHPWNVANGGFLKSASAFFTDPEAKRRTKMWLRYAVARWAHSPSIMAWELFNEIEWVDAMRFAEDTVAAWHKEMATYLREIDPYRHLVTTSSTMQAAHLWDAMDYYQGHTYPVDVVTAVSGMEVPQGKPFFFGEFGLSNGPGRNDRAVVRDGVYSAMLSNHAGSAMYWSWDRVELDHLYGEYRLAREILNRSKLAAHDRARPVRLSVSTPGQGELVFQPGRGWEKSDQFQFELPVDAVPATMARVSSFFQSQTGSHSDMMPQPLEFTFTATVPGTAEFHLVNVSRSGAHMHLLLDGNQVDEYSGQGGDADKRVEVTLKAPYGAGRHTVRISNDGPDWAVFDSFKLAPFGPDAKVLTLAEPNWMMARVTGIHAPLSVGLGGLPLAEGAYKVIAFDLDTGTESVLKVALKGTATVGNLKLPGKDYVLVFER